MTQPILSLTIKQHMIFWLAAFSLFLAFVWAFSNVLLPFVLGLAIAYLLNPMVEYLGNHHVPRWLAALIILGLFFIFVLVVVAMIAPPIYRELMQLIDSMPDYIDQLSVVLAPYISWMQERFGNDDLSAYQQALQENIGKTLEVSGEVVSRLASGGQAFAGFVSVIVLTPIVAFFMMKEWGQMKNWVDNLLPRGSYNTIKELLKEIDGKLAGFVRGQLSVAFALAIIYALALTLAGLKFGFLIGLMSGLLSIIPLVGSTIGLIVSIAVAWFQTGEWSYVGIIAAIFLVGQFVEGNFLTPKLLGKSVGLHPLWILFALLAGGSLFGILGMLLAVPVAAVVGVLLAFAITRYKASAYYTDGGQKKEPAKKSPAKKKKASKKAAKKSSNKT
jgi:predicted PurR-regulated permease PerM